MVVAKTRNMLGVSELNPELTEELARLRRTNEQLLAKVNSAHSEKSLRFTRRYVELLLPTKLSASRLCVHEQEPSCVAASVICDLLI